MITKCTRCDETLEPNDEVVEIKSVRYVGTHFVNLGGVTGYMHSECMRVGYNVNIKTCMHGVPIAEHCEECGKTFKHNADHGVLQQKLEDRNDSPYFKSIRNKSAGTVPDGDNVRENQEAEISDSSTPSV